MACGRRVVDVQLLFGVAAIPISHRARAFDVERRCRLQIAIDQALEEPIIHIASVLVVWTRIEVVRNHAEMIFRLGPLAAGENGVLCLQLFSVWILKYECRGVTKEGWWIER